jgi:hypothetical protein
MWSRTLCVAGVGAGLIVLAGCGATNISGSAAPQGAGATPAGSGARIASVADLGALVQHNASAKSSVHEDMTMTIPGAGDIAATADMKFAGARSAVDMTMTLPSVGAMRVIVDGSNVYLKLPSALSGALGSSGKPWIREDLTGTDAIAKSLGSTANLADQSDPSQLLDKIKSAGTITKVTQEQVDGVATTHYAINVDVRKMAASMASGDTEKQALGQLTATTIPFDIWVNSDNLPVRIVTQLAFSDPTTDTPAEIALTANYTRWGQPVTITAPPAGQVGSLDGH